jgi:hypothetical protein
MDLVCFIAAMKYQDPVGSNGLHGQVGRQWHEAVVLGQFARQREARGQVSGFVPP